MDKEALDFTDKQNIRKKAEEQLDKLHNKLNYQDSEPDIKRLMHELQVHQIELEMQNEELRNAYETAETALKKYTMLYDFAPIGYFTIDSEGSICELNFTGAEMLGDRRFGLINSNFKLFIAEKSRSTFNVFFNTVFTSDSKESCVVMLGYDNHPIGSVYMEGIVIGEDRKCLLSVVDIDSFKIQNIAN